VDYNPNYSYHYDPDTIDFFEYAMEVCDATFEYTEEYLDEAGGAFLPGLRLCPWGSLLVEEVSLTPVPPTPSPTPAPTPSPTPATARAFIANGKVNRVILLTSGSGYLNAPTVLVEGGLNEGGTAARVVAYIGNSVVRSNFIKMKFDRLTQNYFITKLEETESFIGTGSRLQFSLKWSPDIRIGKSSVTVNGVEVLRDDYRLLSVKSTAKG
jgi:hypothetical protein